MKQAKAREDAAMIARRKRMLQTFLNRIAKHPILSNDHVFHRFLDGEVSWVRLVSLSLTSSLLNTKYTGVDRNSSLPSTESVTEEYSQGAFT